MSKELTKKWKNGELFGHHYVKIPKEEASIHNVSCMDYLLDEYGVEVLAPVPSYESLYNPNDGMSTTTGLFTVLKIIKRDIENAQKRRSLTDLECGIKSQVVSLLKKWGMYNG